MTNNWGQQIVSNLEKKGESKDYIIGFLTATIDQMKNINCADHVIQYFERTIEQTKPNISYKNWLDFETKTNY